MYWITGAVLAVLALVTPPTCGAAGFVWLEAEQFKDLGGWTNDSQFIDQMGSPYLLAIGLEGPVRDAVTRVTIPAAGKYRLWVRSRDWTPEYSPGRFEVLVGGKAAPHVFGKSKRKGWIWEDGGEQELAAGEIEVRLHDLTGHYGRCDAILWTSDLSYCPPDDRLKLAAARIEFGGVSHEVESRGPYDTVVVGGGLAGTMAAIASARMGAKTALVQDRPVLGGNGSTEVLVNPEGDTTREPLDPGEGGIIEEFRGNSQGYSERMLNVARREQYLDLYLNAHATGVRMKRPGEIAAVEALQTNTGRRLAFSGRTFIDCTGDGSIGVWAGAEYRHGREPQSMYQETRAPEKGEDFKGTMGGTLRYASEVKADPVDFKAPEWAHKFLKCSDFAPERHPQLAFGGWQWVIEYGGVKNTYDDAEEIRDELLRIIWGMWDHAKNHCPKLAEDAGRYQLTWVSHVVGKRESRRLLGDYVMTEHDIANTTLFPDRVSYGGWGVDLHPPGGFYDPGPPAVFSHKFKFSVPFRSLYSKDVDNLMMAGRCISVSHVALGATRVMITCGLQGQAVGTAAGICKNHQTSPRGVWQSYIDELQQQLLKDGCYLIDLPNHDLRDLALTAKATASSVSPPVAISVSSGQSMHRLDFARAVMFPALGGKIQKVWFDLESQNASPTKIKATLRPAATLGDFSSSMDLASAVAVVPPQSKGWVEFALPADLKPGFYYVWLPATRGLSWRLFETPPRDTARAYRSGAVWTRMPGCYRYRFAPPDKKESSENTAAKADEPKPAAMFSPENVVRGFARAIRGRPNSWRPEPGKPMPQWIELDFGREVAFNSVHVVFQSKAMRADDFRIETPEGDGWKSLIEVTGNQDRRRVLFFDRVTAEKVRLSLRKVEDDMGLCQIRVYDEKP
ncbi:MAG: FAD-dependent oxidoreductase [Thermoguttaceae bacterium]